LKAETVREVEFPSKVAVTKPVLFNHILKLTMGSSIGKETVADVVAEEGGVVTPSTKEGLEDVTFSSKATFVSVA